MNTAHPPPLLNTNAAHHRRLLLRKWARNIHIYTSMLGLLAVTFFSATGIMLNHPEWFDSSKPHIRHNEGTLPLTMLKDLDKVAVVEKLRKEFGATGALESFDVQDDRLELVFRSPGRHAEAAIERAGGHVDVTIETHGFAARMTELHRGTDAGPAWRLVMDGTAVLLLVISFTGLALWLFIPKWRPIGLTAMAACLLIGIVVYFAFVP